MKNSWILFCVYMTIHGYASGSSETSSCGISWNQFKKEYHKKYDNNETEEYRCKIFNENCHTIEEHNKKYDTFKMGMNKFGDMTAKEFEEMFSTDIHGAGCAISQESAVVNDALFKDLDNAIDTKPNLPQALNWTDMGKVDEVVDQGDCKAGWAYSAIDAAWSGLYIRNKTKPPKLSVKFVLECSNGVKNKNCTCGYAYNVFKLANMSNGIPYEASYNKVCVFNHSLLKWNSPRVNVCGGERKKYLNVMSLRTALQQGPVVGSVRVNGSGFQFAKEGVYNETIVCDQESNHEVLVVGYGNDEKTKQDYWIVKNSFGKSWGSYGYLKISAVNQTVAGTNCSVFSAFTIPWFK